MTSCSGNRRILRFSITDDRSPFAESHHDAQLAVLVMKLSSAYYARVSQRCSTCTPAGGNALFLGHIVDADLFKTWRDRHSAGWTQ